MSVRRIPKASMSVTLYDDETDTELDVRAYYTSRPAEKDVGIMSAYAEIDGVTVQLPWTGEVYFNPDDYHMDKIREEVSELVYERQFEIDDYER